jgi:GT2 family glycosyltransferase
VTDLDVVIVAYGAPELLRRALRALRSPGDDAGPVGADPVRDVIVVDNASSAEHRHLCEVAGANYVDPGTNLGFAAGVNRALSLVPLDASDVLLLNPDAEVTPVAMAQLHAELGRHPRWACAAPAQRAPDADTAERVCWPFPTPSGAWVEAVGLGRWRRQRCDFVIGSVMLLRGAALQRIGGFDERFFLYAEEQDWQRRARRGGWEVGYCPDVQALHIGAGTQGDRRLSELRFHTGVERYVRKWYGAPGWASFRTATVVRGVVRSLVRRGPDRRNALELARLYLSGPERRALEADAVPPALSVIPDLSATGRSSS